MNIRILIILLVFITCCEKKDDVTFRIENSSGHNIDTLYLNHTGAGPNLIWPIVIPDIPSQDTAQLIALKSASNPMQFKIIFDTNICIGQFQFGTIDVTNPNCFDPGFYNINIKSFEVDSNV
jgi:hypothetical protein